MAELSISTKMTDWQWIDALAICADDG